MYLSYEFVRWHSANFYEICRRCCGCDAISATLDAYFDPDKFKQLPDRPPTHLKEKGKIVHLIAYVEGVLEGLSLLFFFHNHNHFHTQK